MAQLKTGDKAPFFSGVDQNGNTISISDFFGKKIILYFYPKDDTPGCTAEACNLRNNYENLTEKGYVIIGVSPDNSESHEKFIRKYNLPFILIADTTHVILNSYEAWDETKGSVLRKTYVIAENGTIEKIINDVDTKNHTNQILSE